MSIVLFVKLWRFANSIYNKTSKIRIPIFRNTRLFEINLGHNEFRKYELFDKLFILHMLRLHIETYLTHTKQKHVL